jgi:hypothetical protein
MYSCLALVRAGHLADVNVHLAVCATAHLIDLKGSLRSTLEGFSLSGGRNSARVFDDDTGVPTVENMIGQRLTGAQNCAIIPNGGDGEIPAQINCEVPDSFVCELSGLIDIEQATTRHLPRPIRLPSFESSARCRRR